MSTLLGSYRMTHQDRGGRTYAVDCCVHERVRNAHGVLAISLARRHDERCGPDGAFWTVAPGRG